MARDERKTTLQDYMMRLATFRQASMNDVDISSLALATCGFYHFGVKSLIKCVGCEQEVDILKIRGDPSDRQYHTPKCTFTSPRKNGTAVTGDLETDGCSDFQQEIQTSREAYQTFREAYARSPLTELEKIPEKAHQNENKTAAFLQRRNNIDSWTGAHLPQQLNLEVFNITDSQGWKVSPDGVSNMCDFQKTMRKKTSINSAFPFDFCEFPGENYFYDSDIIRPECSPLVRNSDCKTSVQVLLCDKNPGHFAYFPACSIRPEQIPSSTRDPITLNFLQACSDLTVRISLHFTSRNRPSLTAPRFGTGFMFDELKEVASGDKSMNRVAPIIGESKKYFIFIRTNRHLIFDQSEAEKASVEFIFNHNTNKGTITLMGERVLFSKVPADNTVILVCSSSDRDFVQRLMKTRNEVIDLAERIPIKAKESMTEKIFIIHHPHGADKVVSYGDSERVKYLMDGVRKKLTKIGHQHNIESHVSNNTIRTALLYAVETCPGSSGAPVLTFKRKTLNDGRHTYDLDIWMHNGVDTTNNRGASVMRTYTQEDFESFNIPPPSSSPNQNHEDDGNGNNDDDRTGNTKSKEVKSPVFKVLTHPSYPVYIAYQKRLESFVDWKYDAIHTPSSLALAGFFYAGYADCVRCFQCGLGLRSWKPGDEVSVEHEKHRPTCPFLEAQKKLGIINHASHESQPRLSVEELTVTLLKRENEKLEAKLKCKVCHKTHVRDLFLPCGELYACTDCSKLLTHCPSCNKQILATVNTYFT